MQLTKQVEEFRRALWHFRHGGISQLKKWHRRHKLELNYQASSNSTRWSSGDYHDFVPSPLNKKFGDIRVCVILDDFSMSAWSHEFETIPVTPKNWNTVIDESIDLLFVESAWNGNGGSWKYQLTGPSAPSQDLKDLVKRCRELGIPTTFWNKEDPPHFEDFLSTASLFDVVFTTDENKVSEYQSHLGHQRIEVMNFAAQPAIHNPIRHSANRQRGDIAFAGMYFTHKFPERRKQMDLLLTAASKVSRFMDNGLTIFSRFAGDDPKYQFPARFNQHVSGSLPYSKMLTAYRDFKVFLNVNSVVDSPSMCARRIFEITASGTVVVSAESLAIPEFFTADEVPIVKEPREAELLLRSLVNSPELRDRMVHKAQRKIWRSHTYTHRAAQLFKASEIPHQALQIPRVSVIVSTNRPDQIPHIFEQVAVQASVDIELLLLTHNFTIDKKDFAEYSKNSSLKNARLFSAPSEWSLGRCLNLLVKESSGNFIAKFDDDDFYGAHYLEDQINALHFSGADIVGKEAAYAYLAASDQIILRKPDREHRWTDFVAGPTLVGHRAVFIDIPFADRTQGEDSQFLHDIVTSGRKIYATDRFNFLQVRGKTNHTWAASDLEFLANGEVTSFGFNLKHLLVD